MSTDTQHETTEAGSAGAIHVDRAITELQRGRFVRLIDHDTSHVVGAIETVDSARLTALQREDHALRLVLSTERAQALGETANAQSWQLPINRNWTLTKLKDIAGLDWQRDLNVTGLASCDEATLVTGLELARLASLAPALIVAAPTQRFDNASLLDVQVSDVQQWSASRRNGLIRVSDARVPLAPHEACRFVLFREQFGGDEHVAIVVGSPDTSNPVLVRLHSSCLTGDLFGSLRCDCGEQLRSSVARLGREGGGIILYLAQEGRGIGLANKLRAYQLQDRGLDTLDADRYLGFRHDERDYTVACAMLRELNVSRVRLMTNNPVKIAALKSAGIEVVDRSPLNATVNPHNARYVQTKQDRAGHFAHTGPTDP